jgi:hypothetical protein
VSGKWRCSYWNLVIFVYRSRFAWSFALDRESWSIFVHRLRFAWSFALDCESWSILFTDRDLRGSLPLIANRGQSLFTDRDLLAPLPLITNRGQSLFTNRVLLQGGIPESGTASKVISSPGTVLGNQDDIGSIIASCCICCRAGIVSVNRALEPA